MVNYRVADLHALVKDLRAEGCNVLGERESEREVRLGNRSGWKQGRTLGTTSRSIRSQPYEYPPWPTHYSTEPACDRPVTSSVMP